MQLTRIRRLGRFPGRPIYDSFVNEGTCRSSGSSIRESNSPAAVGKVMGCDMYESGGCYTGSCVKALHWMETAGGIWSPQPHMTAARGCAIVTGAITALPTMLYPVPRLQPTKYIKEGKSARVSSLPATTISFTSPRQQFFKQHNIIR